jgi:hypothetical protein
MGIKLKVYLHIPLVRKLVLFCADRTALVLQTLEVADQRNKTSGTHCVTTAWFLIIIIIIIIRDSPRSSLGLL